MKAKSDLYVAMLPLLNSRRVELLDHPRLLNQLIGLERRTARSGKDSIDHPPGGRDDVINACAGALMLAASAVRWNSEAMASAILRLRMSPNPKYVQRSVSRIQHRFADKYASQLGERALAKLRGY